MRTLLIVCTLVLIVTSIAAWLFRWQVIAIATDAVPIAYELDRWTGDVYIVGAGSARLQPKERPADLTDWEVVPEKQKGNQ